MNKKVLVSILAMTSASTMTAWANANVDKLKTDDLKDWTKDPEGSNLKLEEGGVIVSPDGADIVKTINLAPGTYRLVAGTLTNAKILFGKTELTKVEGEDFYTFKVTGDAPTDSTLTFKAVNQGESRIGGLTLTLVYDFNADRKVLERQLLCPVVVVFSYHKHVFPFKKLFSPEDLSPNAIIVDFSALVASGHDDGLALSIPIVALFKCVYQFIA